MPDSAVRTSFPLVGNALITGASSGLGEHYADFLARNGMDVVLTARSADALSQNAARIADRHDRSVQVLPADLTDRESRRELLARVDEHGPLAVLVNNAGFGTHGPFQEMDPGRMMDEIELNCVALTMLARDVLPGMIERGRGAIINVASTAGFQPLPTMSVYAAAKAYVRSLSHALWSETRGTGVRVLSVCPGPTETDFWHRTGEPNTMTVRRSPEQVIQSTFRALNRNIPEVIDGPANQLTARLAHLLPKRWVLPIARKYAEPRE
jgi:short-subunit dehydrogenase